MVKVNWTAVSAIAAAVSAFLSLIGISVNAWYSKKTYTATIQNRPKLELLNSIRNIIPDYIAQVDYTCYVFAQAEANRNHQTDDRTVDSKEIDFNDFDKEFAKAILIHEKVLSLVKVQGNKELLKNIQNLWACIEEAESSLKGLTKEDKSGAFKQFTELLSLKKDTLDINFELIYRSEFVKLSK